MMLPLIIVGPISLSPSILTFCQRTKKKMILMQKSRLSRWCYNQYVTNHEQPIVVEEEKSKSKNKTIKLSVLTSLEKLPSWDESVYQVNHTDSHQLPIIVNSNWKEYIYLFIYLFFNGSWIGYIHTYNTNKFKN